MRLARYDTEGTPRLAAMAGDQLVDLEGALRAAGYQVPCTPLTTEGFLKWGEEGLGAAQAAVNGALEGSSSAARTQSSPIVRAETARLLAPVPHPPKLFCLAGNYARHLKEGGRDVPGKDRMSPRVFMKPPTTTIRGPGDAIVIPKNGQQIDWEVELAVAIGQLGKYIRVQEAYEYVAGYTILMDVSERALKTNPHRTTREWDHFFDWLNGKWMDGFAPTGPCLALKDEIPDPHDLRLTLRVNGQVKQDANTADMIFSVPELVAFISSLVTLEPGDIISTGTPSGIGAATGEFLKPGDVVEAQIEGIGTLTNPVVAE